MLTKKMLTGIVIATVPGHTLGTIAVLIPVKHQGRTHMALILSGTHVARRPGSMTMKTVVAVVCVLLFASSAHAQTSPVTAAACELLSASLALPNSTVTSAKAVAAGAFMPPGGGAAAARAAADLPVLCRVALTITPTSDSDIRSEIWLPLSGWNGKYLQVGNGAWGGSIQYGALAETLRRGYAAASTDTGHTGTNASFAIGHPEKLIDFGYRSVHETAVQGKATAAALYGAAQATHKDPASFIPATKYPALHQAALNTCDAIDGLKDGLITDPTTCQFDPAVIACSGLDGPSCLTPAQVVAAKRIYAPVIDPKTGKQVFAGLEPGSEMHWAAISGEQPHLMYNDLARFFVFQDPKWDYRTLDLSKHLELARKADNGILSATSPELKPFVARGGKLLIYHGWEDQNISPRSSVDYYTKVRNTMGKDVDESVRLFMVPGMGHCGGGDGPNEFDMVAALEQWREQGKAPAEIIASKVAEGSVIRTRPLCPYPQVAKYKGTGSVDRADSFACAAP